MTARPDPRVGTDLGPYRIEAVIGRGGMGVVYLATHAGLDRKVALKLLAPDYADEEAFRARFLRESRMAAAIDHPNIIPIYDAGDVDGVYFLAMRYVEGTDLDTLIRAGPLAPRTAIGILVQIASALDAAHEAGLVHRDVKPANVLLASGKGVDRADHAYLTDFGLTKHRGSETGLTQGGAFLGTLDYIAPEQVEGKPVDGRADQYALACLAFHGLSGRVPFARETDIAVAMAHLRDAPPSLVELRPELPGAVDGVLARGMAKRPDDRYPDCRALVEDLRAALGISQAEVWAGGRDVSGLRRRRGPLLAAGVGLVALAAAAIAVGSGALTAGAPGGTPGDSGGPTGGAAATASPDSTFPNAAERALLGDLAGIEGVSADTCVRDPESPYAFAGVMRAGVSCSLEIARGASELVVRKFDPESLDPHSLSTWVRVYIGNQGDPDALPQGDCATAERAIDTWEVAGDERGAVACGIEEESGDAVIVWADDFNALLMSARNSRGNSRALYDFFERNARFIAP
jgi:serine/threonine-protein kinase